MRGAEWLSGNGVLSVLGIHTEGREGTAATHPPDAAPGLLAPIHDAEKPEVAIRNASGQGEFTDPGWERPMGK